MNYALILSDGKPGHENQSKALAEGLGLDFEIVPCSYASKGRKTLSYLLDACRCSVDLTGIVAKAATVTKQDSASRPVVLIGTGSNTFYSLKLLRRKLSLPCVAILTPRGYRFDDFDAILAPAFDLPPAKANVISLPTNLTAARPAFYQAQTAAFLERYMPQNKRAVGLIVGGKNSIADVSPEWLRTQLDAFFTATADCEHWVTTSRRTSPQAEAVIASYPFDYQLLFSHDHFNPIPAFVTRCERLFVTAESTGMLSEAVAIGSSYVEILDNLTTGTGKFARFVEGLCREHYAHRFDGTLGTAHRKVNLAPLLETLRTQLHLS
ncbi:MAG: ELM1/GtrOC1 family putative glycosyltransferase [Kiritimatiellia bacterium]